MLNRGIYKKGGPKVGKIHWQAAVRGIQRGGGLDRRRGRGEKKKALPVSGPRRPRNEHYRQLMDMQLEHESSSAL